MNIHNFGKTRAPLLFKKSNNMKMHKIFLIITVLITNIQLLQAQQNKSYISINLGVQNTNLFDKNFQSFMVDEGSYPTKQKASYFVDFNMLYNKPICQSKFETNLGIGFNQKGFKEAGIASDGSPNFVSYNTIIRNSYITAICGLSYPFYSNKNINSKIGFSLIPNINLNDHYLYHIVSLSNRIHLKSSWAVSEKLSITSSLYFETALMYFNRTRLTSQSTHYLPYAFGLNLGMDLK